MRKKLTTVTIFLSVGIFCRDQRPGNPMIISNYSGEGHAEKWVEKGMPIPQSADFEVSKLSLCKNSQRMEADSIPGLLGRHRLSIYNEVETLKQSKKLILLH